MKKRTMKTNLTIVLALLVGFSPFSSSAAPKAAPKKQDIIGIYQFTIASQGNFQYRFLKNGAVARFFQGKHVLPAVWKIESNEVHLLYNDGGQNFLRFNKDRTLTLIATIAPSQTKKKIVKEGWTAKRVK